MPKTTAIYPDAIFVRVPKGWPKKLKRIARQRETSASEFLRSLIRKAIADAETPPKTGNGATAR